MTDKIVAIAEFSIIPLGAKDSSVSRHIAQVIGAIKDIKGVKYELTSMGTILEAENLDKIFYAIKVAHDTLFKTGVGRVISTLRIDDRRDKPRTMESKTQSVNIKL